MIRKDILNSLETEHQKKDESSKNPIPIPTNKVCNIATED
jgi:hypothetical protein